MVWLREKALDFVIYGKIDAHVHVYLSMNESKNTRW